MNKLPIKIEEKNFFRAENCNFCGECLKKCSWMKDAAGKEEELFRRLVMGEFVPEIMDNCANCMSCNSFCPADACPYGLILYRRYERYQNEGIPAVFKRAIPFHNDTNVWSALLKWLGKEEKKALEEWKNTSGSREMLFLGCNQHYDPYIAFSSIFKGLPVFSDRNYCCGEPVLRLGLLDEAAGCAFRLREKFNELGVKRLIVFCPACFNMMTNVIPDAFNIKFADIELIPLISWLKERISNGSIKIKEPLDFSVTIQDSCHGTDLGGSYLKETRELLEILGLSIKEMENSGEQMRCCGLGYAATRYNIYDVVKKGIRRLRETRGSGADKTAAYCNGCYFTMNMMRIIYPFSAPVYHYVELVQMAAGERLSGKMGQRRFTILMAALEAAGLAFFKKKRIKSGELTNR